MNVTSHKFDNGTKRVYLDDVDAGQGLAFSSVYIDFDKSGKAIHGSGTFKASSDSEVKLIALISEVTA